jgi:peptidoglycan/LPS O-acetylase OafA/YrhL
MSYNPVLDGLRAVAIIMVIMCHMSHHFDAFWIGVDVFFVLSGYLITSILLVEMQNTGTIDIGAFMYRRMIRLGPAFAILLVVTLLTHTASPAAVAVAGLYVQNLNIAFGTPIPHGWLPHTWSLATEEQFYLLWPVVLLWLVRSGRRPLLWLGAAATVMVALRCCIDNYAMVQDAPWIRPVGLLVGCALAWITRGVRVPQAAGWVAIVGLCATPLAMPILFVIAPALVAIFSAVVILALRDGGLLATVMAAQPLRYTGRISYSLYLYHYPIECAMQPWRAHVGHGFTVLMVAAMVGAAVLSYELVEKPALRLRAWRWGKVAVA